MKFFAKHQHEIVGSSDWAELKRDRGYLTTELLEWTTYGMIPTKPADYSDETTMMMEEGDGSDGAAGGDDVVGGKQDGAD